MIDRIDKFSLCPLQALFCFIIVRIDDAWSWWSKYGCVVQTAIDVRALVTNEIALKQRREWLAIVSAHPIALGGDQYSVDDRDADEKFAALDERFSPKGLI